MLAPLQYPPQMPARTPSLAQTRVAQQRLTEQWVAQQKLLEDHHDYDFASCQEILEQQLHEIGRLEAVDGMRRLFASECHFRQQAVEFLRKEDERRRQAEREAEKTRRLREEIRRLEERLDARRVSEQRILHDEEKKRRKTDERLAKAWHDYEASWTSWQRTAPEMLTFRCIPWPLAFHPDSPASITHDAVALFILSPAHSHGKTRKDRVRDALRIWHPDRFGKWLKKVSEEERAAVSEGVGVVVRCLNEIAR